MARISLILFIVSLALGAEPLRFDLRPGVKLTYPGVLSGDARVAALNFALHSISWSPAPKPVSVKEGVAEADSSLLSAEQVQLIRDANPYDCSPKKTAAVRADWFIAYAARKASYLGLLLGKKAVDPRKDLTALMGRLGMNSDLHAKEWKKLIFAGRGTGHKDQESRISSYERSVVVSKGKYGPIALTIDRSGGNENPDFNDASLDPFHLRGRTRAGEGIFKLPNGFQGYFIIGTDEEADHPSLRENAPTYFVRNNYGTFGGYGAKDFPSAKARKDGQFGIDVGHDCMTCHREGWQGPSRGVRLGERELKEILLERAKKATGPERKELEKLASDLPVLTEEEYQGATAKANEHYASALTRAKARITKGGKTVPLLPDFEAMYSGEELDAEKAAAELGTTPVLLKAIFEKRKGDLEFRRTIFGAVNIFEDVPFLNRSLSRDAFEKNFCLILQLVREIPAATKAGADKDDSELH